MMDPNGMVRGSEDFGMKLSRFLDYISKYDRVYNY